MAIRYFLLGFLLSSTAWSAPLSNEQKACLFKKPVVIGASISAGTAMSIPGYATIIRGLGLRLGVLSLADFGPSPNRFLLSSYARNGFFSGGETDYSIMFTQNSEHWGTSQIRRLLEGKERAVFEAASVVIGIDAFYWDAIQDNCGNERQNSEPTIMRLIAEARARGVKLILGNVPHEDGSKVIINSDALPIPGLWYAPETACTASINETLANNCSPENGCYVVDLNEMVGRLNSGEKLSLRDGSKHGLYALRPDGVHLSMNGSIYVAERMIEAIEAHPPTCK